MISETYILILVTYHPYTLHLRQQGRQDSWLFFEVKRVQEKKRLGNTVPGKGHFQSHSRESFKHKLIIR